MDTTVTLSQHFRRKKEDSLRSKNINFAFLNAVATSIALALTTPFSGSPKMPISSPASPLTSPARPLFRTPENINFIPMARSHPDPRPGTPSSPFSGPLKIQTSSPWHQFHIDFRPVFRTSKYINFKISSAYAMLVESNVHPTESTYKTIPQHDVPPRTRALRRHLVERAARGKPIHTYFVIQPPHALHPFASPRGTSIHTYFAKPSLA
ncbi:hypothetical protein D9611_014822 [Ephemerocybe angulata]|uniref:Uncharacterized protein n=1 Tax=Ephemerocybe angulata TaxID=980116 RepID=A0A8H5CA76_9AGAR|nr:hypothetical protein D9611_014822 [Tulosesus angulatus]